MLLLAYCNSRHSTLNCLTNWILDSTDNVRTCTEVDLCRELLKVSEQITTLYGETKDVPQHVSHTYVRRKLPSKYTHGIITHFFINFQHISINRSYHQRDVYGWPSGSSKAYKTQSKKVCTHSTHKIVNLCKPFIRIMCSVGYLFDLLSEIKIFSK